MTKIHILQRSRDFAIEAHGDQKYGKTLPYSIHLDLVVSVMARFKVMDNHVLAAGYLHDTIEDTDVTKDDLLEAFGERVALLVDAVTDGPGKNRKERKERVYTQIPRVPGSIVVKLADRIANVEQSLRMDNEGLLQMYAKEQPYFNERLRVFKPRAHRVIHQPWLDLAKPMFRHLNLLLGVHDS